ncbi:hypothetical protein [Marinimicrobium locisalis]|uniref:hypothetical protein n=1 Tax=Marinimicrobium locisalis TaxID=546022 RepID=UPI0032221E75
MSALGGGDGCVYEKADVTLDSSGMAIFSLASFNTELRYDGSTDQLQVLSGGEGSDCSLEIGIVTSVYFASQEPYVAIEGHSGNSRFLQPVDLRTCREIGPSIEMTEDSVLERDTLFVPPICDCVDPDETECLCASASVYQVSSTCELVKDRTASRELTEQRTNVSFEGRKKIAFPGKNNAELLDE